MHNQSSLSCLWRECQDYCLPNMIPSGSHVDNTLDILASHLLRDHIGLPVRTPSPRVTPAYDQAIASEATAELSQIPTLLNDYPSSTESVTSSGRTKSQTLPSHSCSGTHICHWVSCGHTFESCDELTEHLSVAHVGSGKAHYDCYWENCTRNGAQGFSSKQKICRHLQVCVSTPSKKTLTFVPSRIQVIGRFNAVYAIKNSLKLRHCNNICDVTRKRVSFFGSVYNIRFIFFQNLMSAIFQAVVNPSPSLEPSLYINEYIMVKSHSNVHIVISVWISICASPSDVDRAFAESSNLSKHVSSVFTIKCIPNVTSS